MSTNFNRQVKLVLSKGGVGIDVSEQRIVFSVKKDNSETPNSAEIKVYNLSADTQARIRAEYDTVSLQAGYEGNFGLIFTGSVKQFGTGIENSTDSFLHIFSGDGDEGYNFGVINASFGAGQTNRQLTDVASKALGVNVGEIGLSDAKSVRGRAVFGMARKVMRDLAKSNNADWSIQDGAIQVLGTNTPASGGLAYVLNSNTGLIGTPEQTNDGIKAQCLLNPALKIGSAVQINEASIKLASPVQTTAKSAGKDKTPAVISADGFYKVIEVSFAGDTRGREWYSNIVCLDLDATQVIKK